jgi:hypothetical protein
VPPTRHWGLGPSHLEGFANTWHGEHPPVSGGNSAHLEYAPPASQLLYGQIPTRIVELTVDNVTTTETATYVVQRDQPVFSRHCLPH